LICGCGEWDNNSLTVFSRVFLFLLYTIAGAVGVALCHPRFGGGDVGVGAVRPSWRTSNDSSDSDEDVTSSDSDNESGAANSRSLHSKPATRLWYVDFARIACVACVVAEHSGGENYTANNVLLVQQWVLPYLYAASGISYMLSSVGLMGYLLRLAAVFCIGVMFNWAADHIKGAGFNAGMSIFQMAYVVVLMCLAIGWEPIRKALRWRQRHSLKAKIPPCLKWSFWFLYLPLCLGGFFVFLSGETMCLRGLQWIQALRGTGMGAVAELPLLTAQVGGLGVICCLSIAVGTSGWLFWILLFVIMVQQMAIPYKRGFHPFDGDLYLLAMINYAWPMKGKNLIVHLIQNYWPVWMVTLMIWTMPHVHGRCDLDPLNTWWERMRFRGLTAALLVLFFSGAMSTGDPYGVIKWMNMWALYAYCTHVAWARLLPVPWGAAFTYGCLVPFLMFAYRDWHRKKQVKRDSAEL